MLKFIYFTALLIFSILTSCRKAPFTSIDESVTVIATSTNKPNYTIVIIGSSSAAGVGATPIDSSWAYRLRSSVLSPAFNLNIINLAKSGYTTYQGMPNGYTVANRPNADSARNINKVLLLHPTLVLINYATNDVANGYSESETMNNYSTITSKLDSAKIKFILFGSQPRNITGMDLRMRLKTLNDKMKNAYLPRFNDILDKLSGTNYTINPAYDSGDGTHLNNAGHAVVLLTVIQHSIFKETIN